MKKNLRRIPLFFVVTFLAIKVTASCVPLPALTATTIGLSGAGVQTGSGGYYGVEVPVSGKVVVTFTAGGDTPCPTAEEACKCKSESIAPKPTVTKDATATEGAVIGIIYSIDGPSTTSSPDGQIATFEVTPNTAPGEYKFKTTKVEQLYTCPDAGWTGGVASKSNTLISSEVTLVVYKITTFTESNVGSHSRTNVASGERVALTLAPDGLSPTWSVDNTVSPLDSPTDNPAIYTAPDISGGSTVTVVFHGISATIPFSVTIPTLINGVYDSIYSAAETPNQQGVGMRVKISLDGQGTVDFYNVYLREIGEAATSCTGYYEGVYQYHNPDPYGAAPNGTRLGAGYYIDDASFFGRHPNLPANTYPKTSYSTGTFSFVIPVVWHTENISAEHTPTGSPYTQYHEVLSSDGSSKIVKMSAQRTRTGTAF